MNKDVIYVEPEDDITDIILKIENSKEKIVALVPPKRAGVFRSVVNIKLIAKAGASSEKSVVLVTVDPSIVKLAAAAKLPVTKDLQSAPTIPVVDTEAGLDSEEVEEDELVEEEDGTVETTEDIKELKVSHAEKAAEEDEDDEESEEDDNEEEQKASKKAAKKPKKSMKLSGNKFLDWIKLHKKLAIFGGVAALALVVFLVWAFKFAPAVDISVAIKTDQKNFSEGITFTDNLADEKAEEGKFYLEQKKIETTQEVNFEATGQKNIGEKAGGEVVVYAYFKDEGSIQVSSGSSFTFNGLSFISSKGVTLSWDGKTASSCENNGEASSFTSGCLISGRVPVTAAESGAKYNVAASNSGWNTTAPVAVYSDKAMSGGTDQTITVVQQSDVEKAKSELTAGKEDENKSKLYDTIDSNYYIIDASFEQSTSAATATPAVDEEVKGDTKPVLKATTTISVYVIDKVKLEEFIKSKADLEDDQKVYDIKDIYIDNLSQISSNATAKLKAQYFIGPKITETEVVDKVKGHGLGDAQREIRDIYGVSDVKIDPSYPWVMTVPSDSNKVKVWFEVKDQNGNEIKTNSDESKSENDSDEESDSKSDSKSNENTKK